MNQADRVAMERKIYSISELNRQIKKVLEKTYAFVWVSGEISNLSQAVSGHIYFSLKDRNAQVAAVIFRTQARMLKIDLHNGISVTGFGRLSVYEPRGRYQVIFEYLEPSGIGKLLAEQEALKARLNDEGLFKADHKKDIPLLPTKVAVITSPKGAVIEDILNVAQRRFDNIPIEIVPASVQGEHAAEELIRAIGLVHEQPRIDVIILARGGGSVEDLQPFNDERLARAIFDAEIPIVSAVGHETDCTIADFVADLRAPTPSAAAELVLPVKQDLLSDIAIAQQRLSIQIERMLEMVHVRLSDLNQRLTHLQERFEDAALKLDDLDHRLVQAIWTLLDQHRTQWDWWSDRILTFQPERYLQRLHERVDLLVHQLSSSGAKIVQMKRNRLDSTTSALNALNPDAVLNRGYSITRRLPAGEVVKDPKQVSENDILEIILANGTLQVKQFS